MDNTPHPLPSCLEDNAPAELEVHELEAQGERIPIQRLLDELREAGVTAQGARRPHGSAWKRLPDGPQGALSFFCRARKLSVLSLVSSMGSPSPAGPRLHLVIATFTDGKPGAARARVRRGRYGRPSDDDVRFALACFDLHLAHEETIEGAGYSRHFFR